MPKIGESAVGTLPDSALQAFATWQANVDAKIADHDDRVTDTVPRAALESDATGVDSVEISNNADTANLTLSWNGSATQAMAFPTANPASTKLMSVDSNGQMAVTISATDPVFTSVAATTVAGTPNFSGAVTMASTLVATGNVTGADVRYTTERWRTVYLTTSCVIASNTFTATAGTYTHTSGGSSTLTSGYYTFDATTDWALIDLSGILDDGDIITGWRIPVVKSSGSANSSTLRGSICIADTAGSISVPGSLSEAVSVAFSGGTDYQTFAYTGSSTVTVDANGTADSGVSTTSRAYYFMAEMTVRGTSHSLDVRCIQIRIKRA